MRNLHLILLREIITSLVTGFFGLAHEGISRYLNNRRQKALHKAFVAMENKINLQCNKMFHLEKFDGNVQYL